MKKLHNVFLIKEVLSYLKYKTILPIIRKNKKIQNILNISLNDYKIYSSIKLAFIKISNFNCFLNSYEEKNPNLTKEEIKEIILDYLIKYSKKENSKICLDLNQEITEEFAAKIKNNIYLYMFSPLIPTIRILFNKYKKLQSIKSITLSEECQKIRKCDIIDLARNFKWNFIKYFKCRADCSLFLDEFIKKLLFRRGNKINLETFYANGNFNYKNIIYYFDFLKQNENLKYLRFFGNQLDFINVYSFSKAFGKLKKLNKLKFTNFNLNLSNTFNIFKHNLKNIEKFTYEERTIFNNDFYVNNFTQINNNFVQNNIIQNNYEIENNLNELNNFHDNNLNNNDNNEILLNPPKNLINLIKCSIISKNIDIKFYTNLINKNKNLEYLQFNIEKTKIQIKNDYVNFIESINTNQNFKALIIENTIENYFCELINSNLKSKNIEKLKLIHRSNLNFDLILKNNPNLKKINFKLIDNYSKNNFQSYNNINYYHYSHTRPNYINNNPFYLNSQLNNINKIITNEQFETNESNNSFKYNFPKDRNFIEISLEFYPEISKTNIERIITYKNLEIISFNYVYISSDNLKILGENLKYFYKIEKLNLNNIFIFKNEKNQIYYPLYEYIRPILINLKDIPLLKEFSMDGINNSAEIHALLRYQLQFLPFLNKNNFIV